MGSLANVPRRISPESHSPAGTAEHNQREQTARAFAHMRTHTQIHTQQDDSAVVFGKTKKDKIPMKLEHEFQF